MEPVLAQLQEEYGDQVDFTSYNGTQERGKADKYGVMAYPTTVLLDAEGKVSSKLVGYQSLDAMRDKMQAITTPPS